MLAYIQIMSFLKEGQVIVELYILFGNNLNFQKKSYFVFLLLLDDKILPILKNSNFYSSQFYREAGLFAMITIGHMLMV
jgi:hypothetical protein